METIFYLVIGLPLLVAVMALVATIVVVYRKHQKNIIQTNKSPASHNTTSAKK